MKTRFFVAFLLLCLAAATASAELIPTTGPCWVKGTAKLNGAAAPAGLALVAVVGTTVGTTSTMSTTVDSSGNYAFNSLAGYASDTVTIKVCGIAGDASEGMVFTFVPFCKTDNNESKPWLDKNIDFSKQADGPLPIGGCTCDSVCTGGHCVNPGSDGVCSSTTDYYCNNDGTCDSSNHGETASNCPNDCTPPSSSGGGGGGGGTQDNIGASSSQFFGTITSGDTVTVLVDNSNIPVTNIEVTANTDLSSVTFKISEITSQPAGTGDALGGTGTGAGEVYQFFSVDKKNLVNSDMSSATMDFRIPLSWFTQNGVSQDNIALYRFNTATQNWDEIVAVKASSDSNYVYYTSSVPGFSYFAIGEKGLGANVAGGKYTAFQIIDAIRAFYGGTSTYTAFGIIDMIRGFYGG